MKSASSPAAESTETEHVQLVRVYHANRGTGSFSHGPYKLESGGHCDVPEDVAKLWLNHKVGGMPAVVMREDEASPRQVQLEQEKEKLSEENKSQAERIANLERMLAELKGAATGTTVPVVADLKPGETPNPQTVVTGEALKTEQAKAAAAKTRK